MKKMIASLFALLALLACAACEPKDEVIVVPSDAERIVELAMVPGSPTPEIPAPTPAPTVTYAEEHYTFSTTAVDGRLTVSADATVRYPASLQLPIARVSAVGFTQEQTSAYFNYFFTGEQPIVVVNNGAASITKQSLRDLIALYEQQIADGTILLQSQLTEDEARAEIAKLEQQIPSAPETTPPAVISDGTMLPGVWMDNDTPEQLLELNVETEQERLNIYAPVNADEHAESHFFYDRRSEPDYYEAVVTDLAPNTSINGMTTTWDDAVALSKEFFAVIGIRDMVPSEAYDLNESGLHAYRFNFVRAVNGVPLAINHEGTRYKGVKTPWSYETFMITIDDHGICNIGWGAPTKTTEIVNPAAHAIPFAKAAELFETMVVPTYEPSTVRYDGEEQTVSVQVDSIVLSLLRIREINTSERTGLYVPAWVFYGETKTGQYVDKNYSPQIVFALNAIDGSVINMEMGY